MSTKLLTTSSQINDAMLRQLHVRVYQHDELLDVGGVIEKQTKEAVKINGSYFENVRVSLWSVNEELLNC